MPTFSPPRLLGTAAALVCLGWCLNGSAQDAKKTTEQEPVVEAKSFSLTLREREESGQDKPAFHVVFRPETWDASQTAVIVCDMWDTHHSENAAKRVVELAPRMNEILNEARQRGATIFHAPSSCMETYKDHPARLRAQQTPQSKKLPKDIAKWCYQIPAEERGVYPIDQKEGGEDDDPETQKVFHAKLKAMGRDPRHPWKSQIATLKIQNEDYVSDSGEEIWSILEQRGLDNVMLVGVHTNMCVLGRPFGLRQLSQHGKNVVLVRDMTDTMYDPRKSPFVSHFTGTDLIVEHVEKFVCPTITSDQILGGESFRFRGDHRPRLVMIIAEDEYRTEESLPPFALKNLGHEFSVDYVVADPKDPNKLAGIELLNDADVALISVRRRVLSSEQMLVIRRYVESGKPLVGIRTASHAFSLRNKNAPEGSVDWPAFDQQVLGGNYHNHHGNGPQVQIELAPDSKLPRNLGGVEAKTHPILAGVDVKSLIGYGSLYKVQPLTKSTTPLLVGSIPGHEAEPIAWTNRPETGNRVFYTSLGHVKDFEQPAFQQLLKNALLWAAKVER